MPVADTVTAQGAVQRLFSLQASDGSFGYWSAFDTGNLWLTAYAVDFLQHARAQGLSVPDSMESRAVAWLAGRFGTLDTDPQNVAGAAYTAIVLARANKLDLSQLRYVASRAGDRLPSDIARFQLAAALTHVGERDARRAPGERRAGRPRPQDLPQRLWQPAARPRHGALARGRGEAGTAEGAFRAGDGLGAPSEREGVAEHAGAGVAAAHRL